MDYTDEYLEVLEKYCELLKKYNDLLDRYDVELPAAVTIINTLRAQKHDLLDLDKRLN